MLKFCTVIILVFLLPFLLFSQETSLLTGLLTDQYTGEPLFGVKVRAWEQGGRKTLGLGGVDEGIEGEGKSMIYVILSDEDGVFSLNLPAGVYQVRFSRYGLEEMEIADVIIPANDTVMLDTSLFPVAVAVAKVTASINSNGLEVQWYPSGPCINERANDYGPVSDFFVFQNPGSQVAVKYDNNYEHVVGGRIFVGDGSFPGPFLGTDFLVRIYDDEGMEGLPGNTLFEDTVIVDQYGWIGLDSLDALSLTDNYYLATYQLNEAPECAPVGCSQYPANSSSLMKPGSYNWVPFPLGNAMIRPWVSAPHENLYVISYRVLRYSNFDPEGDPQQGTLTELASTNNTYYNDYAWGGMPYSCYAYGIKALYSNGSYSPVRISNIVCNPNPCSPSFAIEQSDETNTGNCHIKLTGLTQPFGIYSSLFQTPGTANFPAVPTGNYYISITKPGYDKIVLDTVELFSDTLIELTLQETIFPIENLQVNEFTGLLDWGPGFIKQFDWQCHADSICHEVTTPELDLVFSWHWIMTVTYKYPIGNDPAYVEYSTDHGRTWAVLYEFSQQETWTTIDIDLSVISGEFAGSGIMFQVHDVFGAPYYLDISQVKIWSPEYRVHPEKYLITLDESPEGESDSTFFQFEGLVNGQTYRAGVVAEYSTGFTDTSFIEFTYQELFPPENFNWTEENDTLKFTWTVPSGIWNVAKEPAGYPDALKGYILTYTALNTNLRFEIDDPATTFFSFEKPHCDTATATLSAVYDLSEYGYPQSPFESEPAPPLEITFGGPFTEVFFEDWSVISFAHNCWKTTGNGLAIETGQGHPGPALVYENLPAHYQVFLTSFPISIPQSNDATLYLEFDLNLFCGGQSGYEIMEVQMQQAGSTFWDIVQHVSTSLGNLDWYHFMIDLSGYISTDIFRIRFKFEGIGAEPVQWKIDNIRVHQVCPGPLTVHAQPVSEADILLTWDKPLGNVNSRDLALYRIYREHDDSGFLLFSETTDTFHLDQLNISGKYCYRVAAVYDDQGVFCESPESDTACIISTLGFYDNIEEIRLLCYPNPAGDLLFVKSEDHIFSIYIYNSLGNEIQAIRTSGYFYQIDLKGIPPGVLFIRIEQQKGFIFKKIIHK